MPQRSLTYVYRSAVHTLQAAEGGLMSSASMNLTANFVLGAYLKGSIAKQLLEETATSGSLERMK
jgi:hypothetical protein